MPRTRSSRERQVCSGASSSTSSAWPSWRRALPAGFRSLLMHIESAGKTRTESEARSALEEGVGRRLWPSLDRLVERAAALRPRQWGLIAGALGLSVLYFSLGSGVRVNPEDLFEVQSGEFVAKITEPGELRALESATISAAKDLTIIYLIPEGTYAKKGDVLARFDPGKYETQLEAAQVNLQRVRAGATPAELERAQVRLEQATFALNKAKAGMESQLQSYQAGVEREKANVERAKTLIETAETRLKVKEITAPKDGLVVYAKASDNKGNEKIQLGMIPYEGQPILYLPDPSTIVADTEVNEVDIAKVRVGGPVELELDSFPGVVFHGTVLKIGSLARMKLTPAGTPSGVKVFDVTVKIDDDDQRIRPGLSATVGIIVEHHHNVLSVPLSAVLARKVGHAVLVADGGRLEERRVVLGPSNEHRVVVEAGLSEGERVLVNPPPPEGA